MARKFTDMVDERKKVYFNTTTHDYGITKNVGKRKQVVVNVPFINVYGGKIKKTVTNLLKEELIKSFKINKYKNICVVGLGNREILNDALGPRVLQKLLVTRGLNIQPKLCVIFPNVFAQTGIESADVVLSICGKIKPDLVILIDALATTSLERLCASFQIIKGGITAGSGANNRNKKITSKELNCEIISIGVPMMIYAEKFFNKKKTSKVLKDIILTPCDTKKMLNLISDIISDSLNLAIFNQYSKEELDIMIN